MYKEYIDELMQALNNVSIIVGRERQTLCYEKGMGYLTNAFTRIKERGGQVFFIGNGGSAAIASHMTADFMKNGGMKTYSLYDSAVTTCMGNDYGYEDIFWRPLDFLMGKEDLLVAISSAGNSANIVRAVMTAQKKQGKVITFSGFKEDNRIKGMGDINVYVPGEHYGMVESIHNLILQQIVDTIMARDGVKL